MCLGLLTDRRHAEGGDRRGSSLQLEVAERIELEQPADLIRGRRPDDEIAERLEAGGDVDGVAKGVVQDIRRRHAGRDHDEPRVDSDARGELDPVCRRDLRGVVADCFANREGSADRPLGVVLARNRRAEQCEEAVSGQLRDSTAETLHALAHQPHDVVEEELRPLRTELLGDRRRARDVGDEHRDDPPLSCGRGHRRVIRGHAPGKIRTSEVSTADV